MLDCKKTTCKHYKSLNYQHDLPEKAAYWQIPPPACASCCHFYPDHCEELHQPNVAPSLEEINDA